MQLCILCSPLVPEVFFYYLLIGILTYRIYIVPTGPKSAAPEQLLDLGMKTKNLFRRDALHGSDDFPWGVHGNTLNQKMNMIAVKADLHKMNLVPFLYLQANLFEGLRNGTTQNFSPIFDRTHKMVQKQAFVMVLVDMFTHNHKYMNLSTRRPRQSLGEF